jgi:CBS-domain-containing membrane protein
MRKPATGTSSGPGRRTATRIPRIVADLMSRDVVTVRDDASVRQLARLLWTNGISGVPVQAADGQLVGMVSSHDVLWLAERMERDTDFCHWSGLDTYTVRDIMTPDVFTVKPAASIDELRVFLTQSGVQRAPVVDEGELVGITSASDVLGVIARIAAPAV